MEAVQKDAGNREMAREAKGGNSKAGRQTGIVRAADPFRALKMRAGNLKAALVRDFRILKGVRLAAVLVIDLLIIAGAALDRIAETRLPEGEASRGKALVWIHSRLRQKRGRRMKNDA